MVPLLLLPRLELGMECVDERVDIEFNEAIEGAGELERRDIPPGESAASPEFDAAGERPRTGGVRGGIYRVAFLSNSLSIASGKSLIRSISPTM
jgi:hypothetical protein